MAERPIYAEADVPTYTLPDPLDLTADGRVVTPAVWIQERRPAILALFAGHVYGRTPAAGPSVTFRALEIDANALDGTATRKQITATVTGRGESRTLDILIYVPNERTRAAPPFLGLNFQGNHTVHSDPGIRLSRAWLDDAIDGVTGHRATAATRGSKAGRWAVEKIIACGHALVTAHCNDLFPDHVDGRAGSIAPLFVDDHPAAPDSWGAIGMWAWGLSRLLDYCMGDPDLDASRAALIGHSRLGKAALWAGAQDERAALVISNNSGCGGAALSRRRFGETVAAINRRFPHWFCPRFKEYNDREETLPVDQHMLLALIAPRALYVASAQDDLWADPRGEYLAAFHASPVYRLLGEEGLTDDALPPIDRSIHSRIGYHIRSGGHDVTDFDWQQYLAFAA